MKDALATLIAETLLGMQLGPAGQGAGNRFAADGLTMAPEPEGALRIGIERLEAASLRLARGALVLEIGQAALHRIAGQVRIEQGRPRLGFLQAARAELSDVKVHGPLAVPAPPRGELHGTRAAAERSAGPWCLGPLGSADGTIRAEIVDAHLMFDADVTVPIRGGQIDFNQASVEHVGPDSRMGASRFGLYVDAPNGRSYLYQFSATPVAGVAYERRGARLGPWVTERGLVQLQAFGEGLLRQGAAGRGPGFTEQARLLFDRTAVSGEIRLGDGRLAAPGVQVELAGRADGRNAIRLHSDAVGRGFTLEIASLAAREAVANAGRTELGCDEITGSLVLRLLLEGGQLRYACSAANLTMAGLRVQPRPPRGPEQPSSRAAAPAQGPHPSTPAGDSMTSTGGRAGILRRPTPAE